MTWSATMTVKSVEHEPEDDGNTIVVCHAAADEITTFGAGTEWERQGATLVSNTEGKLLAVDLTFTIEGKSDTLKVGDLLPTLTGHFG